MKIGDTVVSKKTGLPAAGTVVGTVEPEFFLGMFPGEYKKWNRLYPDWASPTKRVIFVRFNSPQKNVTFEEFKDRYINSDISEVELDVLYKWTVPLAKNASYPEDDLEVINDSYIGSSGQETEW